MDLGFLVLIPIVVVVVGLILFAIAAALVWRRASRLPRTTPGEFLRPAGHPGTGR